MPRTTEAQALRTTAHRPRVHRSGVAALPTKHGSFRVHGYRDLKTGAAHVALVSVHALPDAPLVRVHSECLTGDAFGSLRCDCGPQLDASLERAADEGGVVVYLRGHEGRGIGLLAKIGAYALQDAGRDTVQANIDLGWPADRREYGAAAAILADLGVQRLRLLTNNPAKVAGLRAHGLEVAEMVPLEVGRTPENSAYLRTKAVEMGHLLAVPDDDAPLPRHGRPPPRPHPRQTQQARTQQGDTRMSGAGAPQITVDGSGLRVVVVAASWHTVVMDGLLDGARRALRAAGVTDVTEVRVPGSFELPVAAAKAAATGADAVVALGVVIRGGTPHFEYVCSAATQGLSSVALTTGVPVGFGLLTCDDEQQALDRAGLPGSVEDKGAEAAEAAVATVVALRGL